ncbi:galactokinase [Hymenobacter sp. BT175]|uniref:galactokinase n=1 Tax=Hymenobacter translucens TaxID=2886507 RepID=UPI001D0DE046|nr:galactokinase [Hymenobacter translucens]MCC2547308.1 galactokinase [Hymenobacter translucens]
MAPHDVETTFQRHFGYAPLLVRAPGRINLIGEHTDYNNGFVLPAAINKEIFFAVGLNGRPEARLVSQDLNETYSFPVEAPRRQDRQWANYLIGVTAQLQKLGLDVPGFDCVFGGTIPIGSGLSSSAALESGLAVALNQLLDGQLNRMQLARAGQLAEHEFAGVQCGIMDQFASLHGRAGQVVRLDCRSMEYEYFPFDTTACDIVLCNSGVKHALADSEYNTRRRECEQGVALLKQHYPGIESLRDATREQLEAHRAELGDVVYRRCRYVVEENARVEAACRHLLAHDLTAFGQEMYGSHAGLRDDYEVSCRELDFLVEAARPAAGVYGSRMMGGGFGGCTINLVAPDQVTTFVRNTRAAYQQQFGRALETYHVTIVEGVAVV